MFRHYVTARAALLPRISVDSLASHSTFEEVCYLIFHGTLPTRAELEAFDAKLKSLRAIPDKALSLLRETSQMQPIDAAYGRLSHPRRLGARRGGQLPAGYHRKRR